MADMVYSPAIKAQEDEGMRLPPAGTIPRGFTQLKFASHSDEEGRGLPNPLKRSRDNLVRGQKVYNTYCIVCHGKYGEGDGSVVPRFPRPPSLQSEKIRAWADGQFVHIMTHGRNLMPSYASQIDEKDRWAVAHFIRALHRAKNPTAEDLKLVGMNQ